MQEEKFDSERKEAWRKSVLKSQKDEPKFHEVDLELLTYEVTHGWMFLKIWSEIKGFQCSITSFL